jgi:hypothetical protein
LVNGWECSAKLVEIQSVSDDKVRTLQADPVDWESFWFVWPVDQHCDFQGSGLAFVDKFLEHFQSEASVSHVLDEQDVLAVKFIRIEDALNFNLTSTGLANIGTDVNKVTNNLEL